MEEVVGKLWDKWLTRQVSTDYPDCEVALEDVRAQLQIFYRSLGGDITKSLEPCEPRTIKTKRTKLQKIAGSHQRFFVSWQDERSIRLPPTIAIFPDHTLNEFLYFWLVALAAFMPNMRHWLQDNQQATQKILNQYPGLKRQYQKLVNAYLLVRPAYDNLSPVQQQTEQAIRQALQAKTLIPAIPADTVQPFPIALWLYPDLYQAKSIVSPDAPEKPANKKNNKINDIKEIKQRKKAQYLDEKKQTDGLLMFQAEALATWTEQISLDRTQSDEEEEDIEQVAQDMDIINLSRQRKASSAGIRFDLDLPAEENDDLILGDGILLPEWHYRKNTLLPDACQLQTMIADDITPVELTLEQQQASQNIEKLFSMLAVSNHRQSAQPSGDELDLDAWIDNYTRPVKDGNKQNFYLDNRYQYRDVSCLLLADLSLSTECHVNNELKVIDVIRDSLMVFSQAMHTLQDPFAIYGFSSIRKSHIRYHILKNFNMPFDQYVRGRIARIEPGFYTRMGAAIRQSHDILLSRDSKHKILLIISDGKPNDLDQYEGRYGIEDTRHAILAAKSAGLEPFCITIDKQGNDYLPYLFGQHGYHIVKDITQLPKALPQIYANLTHNR